MSNPPDLLALKRKLSPLLLKIDGVSGLGLPSGRLTVYLESESPEIRERVEEVAAEATPGVALQFEVTGPFRSQA